MKYLLIAGLLLSAGCSTHMSQEQCESANWHAIGVSDAWHNELASHAQDYVDACEDYGVSPNLKAWRSGYLSALHNQCPASLALDYVVKGKTYTGPCLADPEFNRTLKSNAEEAKKKAEINRIEKRIQEIEIAKSKHSANQEDLGWEEYQLQQELLDLKGTYQVADPEPINKF